MAHYPLNHHLRPTYRLLAGLAGLYLFLVGVIGIGMTWGEPFFHRGSDWALGLRVNPAYSWLIAVIGLVVLASALVSGNVHHVVHLFLGWGLAGLAMLLMTMIQTDANVLNVSMVNIIVMTALALVILCSGLYGKVGTAEAQRAEEAAAHPAL
jgi:Domain of unknown function (DUF4383)